MVRTPCCEKMGLKKGPWTPAEDRILIDYIQLHGHGNWRALPKQAGLHRCGKSCRLRWTNYLRPDIKRGNFSKEEEDNIIKLHEILGNRWSTIASMLPGRTDNEIKNVWHTHLKKRLKQNPGKQETKNESSLEISKNEFDTSIDSKPKNFLTHPSLKNSGESPVSPQQSFSENSTVTESSVLKIENQDMAINEHFIDLTKNFPVINEDIWSEALSSEISYIEEDFPAYTGDLQLQFPISPVFSTEPVHVYSLNTREEMDFWSNVFVKEEYLQELPEI